MNDKNNKNKDVIYIPCQRDDDKKCFIEDCDNDISKYVKMQATFGMDDDDSNIIVEVGFCENHLCNGERSK